MNRQAFLKTSIEVLKYDKKFKEINGREQLIRMLGIARVNFMPQWRFLSHGRLGQRWEVIELRFPVPLLDEANEFTNELEDLSQYVYEESDDYALHSVEIRKRQTTSTLIGLFYTFNVWKRNWRH